MEKNTFEIPFGAKDSELGGFEYTIPEGYEVEIKDGKVIVRKEEDDDEKIRKALIKFLTACDDADERELQPYQKMIDWVEKHGEEKPVDIKPIFAVGDVMRTKEEAKKGRKDGMPVIISIDDKYYHCNNELIAIKDQYDYEFPPMNRKRKPVWSEEDEDVMNTLIKYLTQERDKTSIPEDKEMFEREISMLKSICYKSLKQTVEYNEKDIELIEDIISRFRYFIGIGMLDKELYVSWIGKLNALKDKMRPQN